LLKKIMSLTVNRCPSWRREPPWYASCKSADRGRYDAIEMSAVKDPFNAEVKLGCGCGRHRDQAAHGAALPARDRTDAKCGRFQRRFGCTGSNRRRCRRSSRAGSGGRMLRRTKAPHPRRVIAFPDVWD
jgi:hypothetical protein